MAARAETFRNLSLFRAFRRPEESHQKTVEERREELVVHDIVTFLTQEGKQGDVLELHGKPYPKQEPSQATDKNAGLPTDQVVIYFGPQIAEIVKTPKPSININAGMYISEQPTQQAPESIVKPE